MKYEVTGVPDDLPVGKYATRVKAAYLKDGCGIFIELEYAGEIDPDNPSLFTMTKHEGGTVN